MTKQQPLEGFIVSNGPNANGMWHAARVIEVRGARTGALISRGHVAACTGRQLGGPWGYSRWTDEGQPAALEMCARCARLVAAARPTRPTLEAIRRKHSTSLVEVEPDTRSAVVYATHTDRNLGNASARYEIAAWEATAVAPDNTILADESYWSKRDALDAARRLHDAHPGATVYWRDCEADRNVYLRRGGTS